MMKTAIITIQALLILLLAGLFFYGHHKTTKTKIIRFPEIKLAANERITQAQMTFQTAHIKAIRNIPVEWYTDINLDVPPNPVFSGNIIVGAAALESTKELPEFELETYIKEDQPKAIKATIMVTTVPGDMNKERKIEITLNKP
jgi:hypothetical protein